MAVLKKNQVNQILFTMVDKTDHVTLETSLASNFTIKRVGSIMVPQLQISAHYQERLPK